MTEQLPISIYVCDDLLNKWIKINSITNKLSAQFNFQAMTANWYGDEEKILFIQLFLETPERFISQQTKLQTKQVKGLEIYSDDAFSFIDDEESQQLICTIAVTESEQKLIDQQTKLLAGLVQVKLQKILNIIAKKFNLKPI